jgi:Bacterial aa3 type cytochrome c oxidase subunit IV
MSIDTSKGHPEMDYAEHTSTYKGFLRVTQISIVFLVGLLVGMYVFLV